MFEDLVFPPDARILEIGCAYGNWAAWASTQVPTGAVVAVDIDAQMLEWARQQFPASRFPNLQYFQGDARELNFEAEPFHYVMTRACLHYLEHPGYAFEAIARHLKPGGRLCLMCLGKGNLATLYRCLFHLMKKPRWQPYYKNFKMFGSLVDPSDCDVWLERAGLVKKRARLFNEPIYFPCPMAFQDWFHTNFTHYFSFLPEGLHFEFSSALSEDYCRRFKSKESIPCHRVWLQLEAIKPLE